MELDLVELTSGLRAQLEAESQSLEPTELREELPTCPPNRWYQSGFLIPSKTNLGEHADDAEEDEFAGFAGLNFSSKGKSNANGDDTGASEGVQVQRVFFPCSIELRLLLPPPPPSHQAGNHSGLGQVQADTFRPWCPVVGKELCADIR